MDKRKAEMQVSIDVKKPKVAETSIVKTFNSKGKQIQSIQVKRTSGLKSPIMLLTGHESDILTTRFSPCGNYLASGSFDKTICKHFIISRIVLWNVYGECTNFNVMRGQNGAILELDWSPNSERIFTACSDKTVGIYDVIVGKNIRKLKGHQNIINSVNCLRREPHLIVSGSDDKMINIWDQRQKEPVSTFTQRFQITSVSFGQVGDLVFAGSLDNDITAWDIRNQNISYKLNGHIDTITGLRLSPDGMNILSASMDHSVRLWDVKPYASGNRCLKIFEGAPHGHEKNLIRPSWSHDAQRVACGSADRTVLVWDVPSRKILYKLPGHKGCVNEVDFHPEEPIIASCSADRQIFLGEIEPSYSESFKKSGRGPYDQKNRQCFKIFAVHRRKGQ
ncbi:wd-repeat protein [Rozella allomycis CSF55]|uniref:Wd-repeat protein n=1 Tax=Rozella allomycis (strain CSF55) TaxID=988480 RepID=A0A075AUF2_ROZAC|nr:hypothetical protein O9G_002617 [Rozella allomycis CSF55]RKP21320.1 wd-repeat protein [Rozella allomycis CSF55]|eukprot:EPZ32122.1 hypothetical protein O9G_002617 [Rozella allomycis CSF55]